MESCVGKFKVVTSKGFEFPIGPSTTEEAKKIAQRKKQEEGLRGQAVKLILLHPKNGGVEIPFE